MPTETRARWTEAATAPKPNSPCLCHRVFCRSGVGTQKNDHWVVAGWEKKRRKMQKPEARGEGRLYRRANCQASVITISSHLLQHPGPASRKLDISMHDMIAILTENFSDDGEALDWIWLLVDGYVSHCPPEDIAANAADERETQEVYKRSHPTKLCKDRFGINDWLGQGRRAYW